MRVSAGRQRAPQRRRIAIRRRTGNHGVAPGAPGFTLLEAMLSVTLAVGLVGALLGFYDHATNIRARIADRIDAVLARRAVMDRMTDELRGALAYPFLGIGMEGGGESVRFVSATLPGPAVWAVRTSLDDPIRPEHDMQIVGYRLRTWEDDSGETHIDGVERTCQKVVAAQTAEEGEEIAAFLLTPRLKFLRLRYWDGANWVEGWGGGDLPRAVEIVLGAEPLPEGMDPLDYPELYETSRRVVFLPGSVAPAAETGAGEEGAE